MLLNLDKLSNEEVAAIFYALEAEEDTLDEEGINMRVNFLLTIKKLYSTIKTEYDKRQINYLMFYRE